jgi:hypothetical protein
MFLPRSMYLKTNGRFGDEAFSVQALGSPTANSGGLTLKE